MLMILVGHFGQLMHLIAAPYLDPVELEPEPSVPLLVAREFSEA